VDFGVASTGVVLGVEDWGGETVLSGFGVGGAIGAATLSIALVIATVSSFSETALEPLTLTSVEGFVASFAIGSSKAGIGFASSSFFGISGS